MSALIITIHIVVCLALIAVVLLQHGKGADIGAAFGAGASQTVFGSRGAGDFLTRLTTGAAIIFMLTSLSLTYFVGERTIGDIVGEVEEESLLPEEEPEPEEPVAPSALPGSTPIEESEAGATSEDVPEGFEEVPLNPSAEGVE